MAARRRPPPPPPWPTTRTPSKEKRSRRQLGSSSSPFALALFASPRPASLDPPMPRSLFVLVPLGFASAFTFGCNAYHSSLELSACGSVPALLVRRLSLCKKISVLFMHLRRVIHSDMRCTATRMDNFHASLPSFATLSLPSSRPFLRHVYTRDANHALRLAPPSLVLVVVVTAALLRFHPIGSADSIIIATLRLCSEHTSTAILLLCTEGDSLPPERLLSSSAASVAASSPTRVR